MTSSIGKKWKLLSAGAFAAVLMVGTAQAHEDTVPAAPYGAGAQTYGAPYGFYDPHQQLHNRLGQRHDNVHDRLDGQHDAYHYFNGNANTLDHELLHRQQQRQHNRAHRRLNQQHNRAHFGGSGFGGFGGSGYYGY
jgi:hypothetical protein